MSLSPSIPSKLPNQPTSSFPSNKLRLLLGKWFLGDHNTLPPPLLNYHWSCVLNSFSDELFLIPPPLISLLSSFTPHQWYPPPRALVWKTCDNCLLHPSDSGDGFFPPPYITCLLALLQHTFWFTVSWPPSVNIHSTVQQVLSDSLSICFHGKFDLHLLA